MPTRILIVDDSATIRLALRHALRDDGYELAEAPSAERALHVARLLRPAVVVADLNLPGMSGLDLMRQLRADPSPPAVILVSGEESDDWAKAAQEAGAAAWIRKPMDPARLREAVARLTGSTP